jgi:hypothetical protein
MDARGVAKNQPDGAILGSGVVVSLVIGVPLVYLAVNTIRAQTI